MDKSFFEKFDLFLFVVVSLLAVTGLVAIYSATYTGGSSSDYFSKQLTFTLIGISIMLLISFIPPRYIKKASPVIYILSITLLVLVLIIGKKISGSKSWFAIGSFGIQPAEFAKLATILFLATFLSRKEGKEEGININNPVEFIKAALIVIIPFALIMQQPDMGTALVFLAMVLPVFFWAGLSPFAMFAFISPMIAAFAGFLGTPYFVGALILIIGILFFFKRGIIASGIVLGLNAVVGTFVDIFYDKLAPYQQNRIMGVFDPTADPLGSGYNVIQSKIAIGSGGLAGKGFLEGTQTQLKFIPEQWTDFIFCMIGEEFGFIGAIFVIALYTLLIIRIISNASQSKNSFLSIACIGIVSIFLFHFVINVGMTIGIMPVIGIPLPLMSYGISSLLSFLIMIGIGMSAYRHKNYFS
jgi:rod shape determining protein RodA